MRHILACVKLLNCSLLEPFDNRTADAIEGPPERTSHDENETFYCRTHRHRISGITVRRKRADFENGRTKQHAQHPRSAGTARHDWKFRADCRDGDGAVGRNVYSAICRRHQLGPHLE